MTYQVIGTCSICGGQVTIPTVNGWGLPPTPVCQTCGAKAAAPALPVIPMQAPRFHGSSAPKHSPFEFEVTGEMTAHFPMTPEIQRHVEEYWERVTERLRHEALKDLKTTEFE